MMENKLWMRLCALLLLLINAGSANHDDDHTAAPATTRSPNSTKVAPSTSAPVPLPDSSLNQTSHAADAAALNGSDANPRSNGSVATEGESPPVTPQPKKYNDSITVDPIPENYKNVTDDVGTQPHPTESHAPTTQVPSTSTAPSPHTDHTPSTGAAPPSNTSAHSAAAPTDSKTDSPTSSPTKLLPRTNAAPTNTTSGTHSATTSSGRPPQETHNSQPTPPTPPSNTPQTDGDHEASEDHPKTTVAPASSSSTQAKPPNNPSQLNFGGDSTMTNQESPTLDPLLASLVTAFVVTAVIITLLLFLKLRRRDNRPEFRRLQDLPMDDMMEDTPLSMYSY